MPVERSQYRRRPVVPRNGDVAEGVPAPSGEPNAAKAEALARVRRGEGGKIADSASAAILGALGGQAKADKERELAELPRLLQKLGLRDVTAADFELYLGDAAEFADAECQRLRLVCGGGEIGWGPSSMVQSAALELAGSRYSFAKGDIITGSRLAGASRANLMSARDECAREAQARPKSSDDHTRLVATFAQPVKGSEAKP